MNEEYLNTFFRITDGPSVWPADFVIVTAFNPDGVLTTADRNQSLDSNLAVHLQQLGLHFWRVTGGSPDFTHAEPGYAIETELKMGIDIGIQFRQVAVFWISRGDLFLVECFSRQQTPMGKWLSRIER
jgi:hypothetical protein